MKRILMLAMVLGMLASGCGLLQTTLGTNEKILISNPDFYQFKEFKIIILEVEGGWLWDKARIDLQNLLEEKLTGEGYTISPDSESLIEIKVAYIPGDKFWKHFSGFYSGDGSSKVIYMITLKKGIEMFYQTKGERVYSGGWFFDPTCWQDDFKVMNKYLVKQILKILSDKESGKIAEKSEPNKNDKQ